jgi:hypothetical protein
MGLDKSRSLLLEHILLKARGVSWVMRTAISHTHTLSLTHRRTRAHHEAEVGGAVRRQQLRDVVELIRHTARGLPMALLLKPPPQQLEDDQSHRRVLAPRVAADERVPAPPRSHHGWMRESACAFSPHA